MYNTVDILKKLNEEPALKSGNYSDLPRQPVTLADIMMCSLPEVSALSGGRLNQGEQRYLWEQAQNEEKANRMLDSQLFSRANPQLANAIRLGISQSASVYAYNNIFADRAGSFVKPGTVSSMFSPAAYLTELYREASQLYQGAPYHLDSRRPDLQLLALSQENLDTEISTLKLSNEILEQAIGQSHTDVKSVYNPYFDQVRQAIVLQDPDFSAFYFHRSSVNKPDTETLTLLFLELNLPPSFLQPLTEPTEKSEDRLNTLSQLTGFSVSDITRITDKPDEKDQLKITRKNLEQLALVRRYTHRYPMSFTQALTMINAPHEPLKDAGVLSVLGGVFNLDTDELVMMFDIIYGLKDGTLPENADELPGVVNCFSQLVQWLKSRGLRPVDLFMMLKAHDSDTKFPFAGKNSPKNIELLTTLRHGLSSDSTLTGPDISEAVLFNAAAPLVAAVFNLDSAQKAIALLQWLNQLRTIKQENTGVKSFILQLLSLPEETTFDSMTDEQVLFCQQLLQLTLIVHSLQLTTAELVFAVDHPDRLYAGPTTLSHDLKTILLLDSLHHGLQRSGSQGSEILSALQNGALTLHQLSLVTGGAQELIAGALTTETNKQTWEDIDRALQWVDLAARLGVSVQTARDLLALDYSGDAALWKPVADALLSSLDPQQTMQLEAVNDENRSAILSFFAVTHFAKIWEKGAKAGYPVNDRNDLYSWLLLDNQVSAQVKTTRIGEAIASIQLYISQALAGQYGNADAAVLSRPFFTQWDRYNKDYSSWAGLSQLVYYPENYIDPTLRLGQTGMMGEMLQTLSQGQLNSDAVESAFKTYLTRFEEVANLNVINAYHDSLDETSGKTYLLSRSDAGQYYWRSADVSLMKDGRLPASAWSEWKKIDIGIVATGDLIRPVIFQDRLYLFWLESQRYRPGKIKRPDASNDQKDVVEYTLKYAHIRHDGSWTAPVNLVTESASKNILFEKTEPELSEALRMNAGNVGIFCARHSTRDAVYLCIYDINKKSEKPFFIVKVLPDGPAAYLPGDENKLTSVIEYHLDSEINKKGVNTLFIDGTQTIEVATPTITSFQEFKLLESPPAPDDWRYQFFRHPISSIISFDFDPHASGDKKNALKVYIIPEFAMDQMSYELARNYEFYLSRDLVSIEGIKRDNIDFQFADYRNVLMGGIGAEVIIKDKPDGVYLDTFYRIKFKLPVLSLSYPQEDFTGETAEFKINYVVTIKGFDRIRKKSYESEYQDSFTVTLVKKVNSKLAKISLLYDAASGAKTIQYGDGPQIRINTLFARQLVSLASQGAGGVLSWNAQTALDHEEPDIFSSANALYFWEMFYYIPMMVFHRLLQDARFTEATQWIKYVWRPEGYIVDGKNASRHWNVKPLEDNISWNATPLESVDPDAVAQADPMHYKVATFMSYLDLLIARGDAAYRRLERDTLNEAKMWYVQALALLGEEPPAATDIPWSNPTLATVATPKNYIARQQSLLAMREALPPGEKTSLMTANSLTGLFLPQQNEKLQGYWRTLRQRLFNLRHDLSIDGQPLTLPVYARPADPQILLTAAVNATAGSSPLPAKTQMPMYRFPVILDSAKNITGQLVQFGASLLSLMQLQDAEKLSLMLQNQGAELMVQSILIQQKVVEEAQLDIDAIQISIDGAGRRMKKYKDMIDENISDAENTALGLSGSSTALYGVAGAAHTVAGVLDFAPNIFGLADGGSKWGAVSRGTGYSSELVASAMRATADTVFQKELYRRRMQEWEIQHDAADYESRQLTAQKKVLEKRKAAASDQLDYLRQQKQQISVQQTFLRNKFTSQALYSWLQGKLSSVYYQFYDLAVSRCLMAQEAYRWSVADEHVNFIRPGAWRDNYAGLMSGETLMLNLHQMEQAFLSRDERQIEITRTQSLAMLCAGSPEKVDCFPESVRRKLTAQQDTSGNSDKWLKLDGDELQFTVRLSDLNIAEDYPADLGKTRRVKQISVTLPALTGPYQDVRCVLSYGGTINVPRGCKAIAISHGMNDSGLFQLDFNDSRWLPFEGIPVDDPGILTLRFPHADSKQKDLLLSLTDIILHIRYTIID
ncbi:neuraminidase-like domain-containing protein [Pantoea ananatis]|uniref:Tc toxin subunit A-related protein n=1 Tax=Pantoea ananas TaxID=553 RepID=UPI0024AD19D8|nr:neuraminidase-like domain-containing protein [Pantoea ananatis]MDI6539538.1 neuraminidase-like domain-containing protein [Pantoea ananatis]